MTRNCRHRHQPKPRADRPLLAFAIEKRIVGQMYIRNHEIVVHFCLPPDALKFEHTLIDRKNIERIRSAGFEVLLFYFQEQAWNEKGE